MRTPRRTGRRAGVRDFSRRAIFGAAFIIGAAVVVVDLVRPAGAFVGPTNTVGTGSGAIGTDSSNNVSVGTAVTVPDTKLFVLASSTGSLGFAVKVFQPGNGPLFVVRNDGKVAIGAAVDPSYALTVSGNANVTGTLTAGTYAANVSASNISSGAFGSNTGGGNYSFPASVGVGTTSPGAKLDVNAGDLLFSGGTTPSLRLGSSPETNRAGIQYTRATGLMEIYNGTASETRIAVTLGGNVGLGTTNPANGKLQVNGKIWAEAGDIVANGDNQAVALRTSSGLYTYLQTDSSGNLQILKDDRSTARMVIQQAGNVGIGSTSPTQKLDVTGNINASTGLCIAGDCKTAWGQIANQWTTSGNNIYNSNTGNVGIGSTSPAQKLDVVGSMNLSGTIISSAGDIEIGNTTNRMIANRFANYSGAVPLSIESTNNDLTLGAGSGAPTERVRILSSNGNVGIGNTNPTQKLDVTGNVNVSGNIVVGGTISGSYSGTVNAGNVSSGQFGANTGGGNYSFPASVGIGTNSPGSILDIATFSSGGSRTVTIKNSGQPAVNFGSYPGAWTAALAIQNNDNSRYIWLNPMDSASGANARVFVFGSGLDFYTGVGSGTYTLTMTGGNVGIANTNPSQKLDVTGNINASTGLCIAGDCKTAWSQISSQWTTSGSNIYYNSGNVGVGTTGPTALLTANGSSFPQARTYNSGDGLSGIGFLRSGSANEWIIYRYGSAQSDRLCMGINGVNEPFCISTNGNVGIANTNPSQKLDVTGNVNVSGNIVAGGTISGSYSGTVNAGNVSSGQFGANTGGGNYSFPAAVNLGVGGRLNLNGGGTYGFASQDLNIDTLNTGTTNDPLEINYRIAGPTKICASVGCATYSAWFGTDGKVGIGNTSPSYTLDVSGSGGFSSINVSGALVVNGAWTLSGAAQSALNMNGNNITGVNKLTVSTVDPVYEIGGVKYATYGASITGGVYEEYVGRAEFVSKSQISNLKSQNYEYVIDFSTIEAGSDLWVWRHAVDFSSSTVEVFLTPYGQPALLSYEVADNTIVVRGDAPAEFSYRLVSKRFDWRSWPTRANNQSEPPSFVIP